MLRRLRPRSVYDVMAAIACFGVLAGGSAYAANTIASSDIIDNEIRTADVRDDTSAGGGLGSIDIANGEMTTNEIRDDTQVFGGLFSQDLAAGSVRSSEVQDNSLTGADINEGSLGAVPAAVLGGLGRMGVRQDGSQGPGNCDPESLTFVNCDIAARLTLARPARVLVIGSVVAVPDVFDQAAGECLLGTTSGPIPGTQTGVVIQVDAPGFRSEEHLSIAGVTGVLPAGEHAFGVDCNDRDVTFGGGMQYEQAKVTAVALSDQ
jgi:hypothetical protein